MENTDYKIFHTYDYEKFKIIAENRQIYHQHVIRIKNSMRNSFDLHLNPIIVNSKFEIVDGQHRFMAAKELKKPIFYVIDNNYKNEKIKQFNVCQKSWKLEDYFYYYDKLGNKNYTKVINLSKELKFRINVVLNWVFSTKNSIIIKEGKYQFDISDEIYNAMIYTKNIIKILEEKRILPKNLSAHMIFHHACKIFLLSDCIDVKSFFDKLENTVFKIEKCFYTKDYIDQFIKIYNFKRINNRVCSVSTKRGSIIVFEDKITN